MEGVAADQQQLGSIDLGCPLAAYFGGKIGSGQRCCWPLNADPLGGEMWEVLIKLGLTVVIVAIAGGSLHWIWTHQVDPGATLSRIFKGATQPDWVATRDPNLLYRDGQPAARITGPVDDHGDEIIFHQLADAPDVRPGITLEYQRRRLVVEHIRSVVGTGSSVSPGGTQVLQNVREGVVCRVVQ